jgi:hypothetical protein
MHYGGFMRWVDLAVKPYFSWPNTQVEFQHEGKRLVLQPKTEELACTASIYSDAGLTFDEGGSAICRFLSCLSWSKGSGVSELFIAGSNNPARPGRLGQGTYGVSPCAPVDPCELLYLPQPRTEKAKLVLGLFREGMSVNSIPFAFLSYFKILNVLSASGNDQKAWINSNLQHLWYQPAIDRLNQVRASTNDVGAYLYHQGRCAVAHAFDSDVVNPDRYDDKKRLELDLPLMKDVAALCVEREFGVLSDSSFWEYLRANRVDPPELLQKHQDGDGRIVYRQYVRA